MSIKRLSGAGLTTPKSNKLWDQTTFQSGMFALATVKLTTATSTIEFSGIPTDYTHLQVRAFVQTTRATYGRDSVFMKINSGTAANFSWHFLMGEDGSTATAQNGASANYILIPIAGTTTGGTFGAGIIDILDYSNASKTKTVKCLGGIDHNGLISSYGGVVGLMSGNYRGDGSAAVSTITFTAPNNFAANTHFALYGIKVA